MSGICTEGSRRGWQTGCPSSARDPQARARAPMIAMTWEVYPQPWGRSAGFPAELISELVSEDAVRAISEAHDRGRQLAAVDAELRAMLAAASAELGLEQRRHARRLRRAIRAGRDLPLDAALGLGLDV